MSDLVGKHFHGYHILGQIGTGGGSNVFKASTPQGEEILAIKFFSRQIGRSQQLINKLRTTFQSVITLEHPSILPNTSFNVHDGYPYVVMPFMGAGSLQDRIEFGALAAINPLAILRDVVSALEAIHAQSLVHGDLKPSNILFDEDGSVLLGGIGEAPLARLRANQLRNESDGRSSYQAPEVIEGKCITPASDQYSLGLIALELLTRLPVDEALNAIEHLQRDGRGNVTRPSPYALDLTAMMMAFLLKTLSFDPADRFSSMKEWKRAFMAAFSNEELPSEPETELAIQGKPRRNRLVLLAPILALILCLVVAVPALTSPGGGAVSSILASLGLLKDEPANYVSSEEPGVGISLGTSTPEDKAASLGDVLVKTTSIPKETNESGQGGGSGAPTNTSAPPAKKDPTKPPAATQVPQDQATATITFTPTPTGTGEVTGTATETPTEDPEGTPTETPTASPVPPTLTATEEPEPTIDPELCRSKKKDKNKENYCTPTPK